MAGKKKSLEDQFRAAVEAVNKKLSEAEDAYEEADALAQKHGISISTNYYNFQESVVGSCDPYIDEKWNKVDKDLVAELTGLVWHAEDYDEDGNPVGEVSWEHSSC